MYKKFLPVAVLLIVVIGLTGCGKKETTYINTNEGVKTSSVTAYMIAEGDKGKQGKKIGCDDSLVPLAVTVVEYPVTDVVSSVKSAFAGLASVKDEELVEKKLSNPLKQSQVKLDDVVVNTKGETEIKLSGSFAFSGTCDAPRQRAQVEELITKASLGTPIKLLFNGSEENWGKAFSGK